MTDNVQGESTTTLPILPIELTDTMAQAGGKILAQQLTKMLEHEAGSRTGEDIESVHDMRVATRRMRSLLRLLKRYYQSKSVNKYGKSLQMIARTLGEVRDFDVLISDLQMFASDQKEDVKATIVTLIARLDKRRQKARAKLIQFFDSPAYSKFIPRFSQFIIKAQETPPIDGDETPHQIRHLLPILLHERLAAVRAYETVVDGIDEDTLHALRVEFKRLRYAVEFFHPVLGSSADSFVDEIKTMQDNLGRANDLAVFQSRIKSLKKLKPEEKALVKDYLKSRKRELKALREQFPEQWSSFNKRTTQRQFSDALLVLR